MPHKRREKSNTDMYHVFVRGINKEKTFNQNREKNYFKRIIKKYLKKYNVEIYSYCIMSTHAHLMIKAELEELSLFMSKILAEYAQYYNYKHNRNGHVFQNRFGSECIESKRHFLNCLRYIHMNPVKACMVSSLSDYKYSSIGDYRNEKTDILHENAVEYYKENFKDWTEFFESHFVSNAKVFIDTKEEMFIQRRERAFAMLWDFQKEKNVDNAVEILEEPMLREEYQKRLKEELQISSSMCSRIYNVLKKELIG